MSQVDMIAGQRLPLDHHSVTHTFEDINLYLRTVNMSMGKFSCLYHLLLFEYEMSPGSYTEDLVPNLWHYFVTL